MQNPHHHQPAEDKFVMNFGGFDAESLFNTAPMVGVGGNMNMGGMKRSAHEAGLDREALGLSSDDDSNDLLKKDESKLHPSSSGNRDSLLHHHHHHPHHQQPQQPPQQQQQQQQTSLEGNQGGQGGPQDSKQTILPNGKKTKGRVKIKMEFIDNKLRRYTTFSKRKTGIMKKAYELSTLTGTQVMLLVASETGHVYTFATRKLQPMITSEAGKALIQTCLNSPDPPSVGSHHHHDQRMSATGYEETELTYAVTEEEHKVRQMMYTTPLNAMHQNPQMSSPSHHPSLALQSHHHSQYQPHPPPTPHLTPPSSANHPLSHHLPPTSHADHVNLGLNHHAPHLGPTTPLSAQSPLPPPSPICTSSPSSPYPVLHHHPHHTLQAHTR
ncbi:UNVERIFIED_CONTAM: hypothetical protein RMT77_013903 [Armadillidium vulgare]